MASPDQQTAIIIGAGPYISRSLALHLAKSSFGIGLISRTQATLDKLAAEINEQYPLAAVHTRATDAGDPAALTASLTALATALHPSGKLDVLAHNAARVGPSDLLTLDPAFLEQDFRASAVSTLVAGQWFAAHANTPSPRSPLLLITGGTLDRAPSAAHASLSCMKAASQNLGTMFATALKEKGILVGMPLVVEPIIPKDGGGWATKSDPDVIVRDIFVPFLDGREKDTKNEEWKLERIF